jgi:hypothetical protein
MPVSRVVVNTSTALSPSLTLGWCHATRTLLTHNVAPLHLMDIMRIAFETQPSRVLRLPRSTLLGSPRWRREETRRMVYRFDGPRFRELASKDHAGNRELFRIGF